MPQAAVAVWALAAETEAEAERLFTSRALWRLGRDRGHYAALPSAEDAAAYPATERERAQLAAIRARALCGTGRQVMAQIVGLAASLGVEEVAVLTAVADKAARRRSYTLLAQAARLGAEDVPAAAE